MKILITGATGFIGSEVLARLLGSIVSPSDIYIVSRKHPRHSELLKRRFEEHHLQTATLLDELQWVGVSLDQPEMLRHKLNELPKSSQKWRVIHLAALISTGHSPQTQSLPLDEQKNTQRLVNIGSTRELLEWANANAELFIFTSSVVAFGGLLTEEIRSEKDFENFPSESEKIGYFSSKRAAHIMIRDLCKIPSEIFCPGIVHGAFDGFKASRAHLKSLREGTLKWAPPGGGNFVGLDRVAVSICESALQTVDFEGCQTRLLVDQNLRYVDYFNLYLKLFHGSKAHQVRKIPMGFFRLLLGIAKFLPLKARTKVQISESIAQSQYFLWFKSAFPQPKSAGLEVAIKSSINTLS